MAELSLPLGHMCYISIVYSRRKQPAAWAGLNTNSVATKSTSVKATSDFERYRLYKVVVPNYFLIFTFLFNSF